MGTHKIETCKFPRWAWRYRNRIWVCSVCDRAWTSKLRHSYGGSFRNWEEWGSNGS